MATPVQPLTIVWSGDSLVLAGFTDSPAAAETFLARHELGSLSSSPSMGGDIENALRRYFSGEHSALDKIPLAPVGTAFNRRVWRELRRIPAGATKTYGQVAAAIDCPGAARAVGRACHDNPAGVVVPCHRVVGCTGGLRGYAGGLHIKEWLLSHEGVAVSAQKPRQSRLFA